MKTRKDYDLALDVIGKVVNEWDPYCLLEGGAPKDEFDAEIRQLATYIPRISTPDDAHDGGSGGDEDVFACVDIVEDVRGGQFSMYFCSTDCLRAFLNSCVDELDRQKKQRGRFGKPSKKGPKNAAQKTGPS